MMFSYYGSKSKIIDLYPAPKYGKIIEPFAGSARYSLKWFDRDVLLIDKYEKIVKIWKWLQSCSEGDILGLPKLRVGDDVTKYGLCDEATYLLGMLCAGGSTSPRKKVAPFGDYEHGNQGVYKKIAGQLFKIKHWTIRQGDYKDLANEPATWFIDPPYFSGGHAYVHNKIDYAHLAEWCKSRQGQAIVCENTKANWLPFWPMVKIQGIQSRNTTESIWSNMPLVWEWRQKSFFGGE